MELDARVMDKINNGREYRNTAEFEIRKKEDDQECKEAIVEGYATTFNEPYLLFDTGDYRLYESVSDHAFDECDMRDTIMQYDHCGRVFARISNGTLQLNADDHGMHIRADLGGTAMGRQLYEEIKGGYTNKMSFGFIVAEDERKIVEDRENNVTKVYRTITKISKLFDVSAVSIPANDATEISSRCVSEGVIADAKGEILAVKERENRVKILKLMLEV